MSRDRIRQEAGALQRPGSEIRCVDDGERVVVVLEPYQLPVAGAYSTPEVSALAFVVPATYPDAQPDASGFYLQPTSLRLANSNPIRSTADADLLGAKWLKFSWSPKTVAWDPATDTLATYLANIEARFLRRD